MSDQSLLLLLFTPVLAEAVILGVPLLNIVHRSGRTKWWLLLLLLPIFGPILLLWIAAFFNWPRLAMQARHHAFSRLS
jgi:hypothetical protein